jgi:hypothetical protein
MAALPQCDAYGYIYDTSGGPAQDVLVTLKRVDDVNGNPITLIPESTLTDATGTYRFTLPQLATAHIVARATTLWDCNGGIPFAVPAAPTGELAPILVPPPEAQAFVVQPPLHYAANILSISQATADSDGYLTAADWVRFDAGGTNLANYVPLAGATMTGYLTLVGNPLATYHAATKNYVDLVRTYVDDSIAAIPLPPPLDTAADYTWTGTHKFVNKKFLYTNYVQSATIGDPIYDGLLSIAATGLLQLYSPNEIKISGQSVQISANITAAHTQFLHPTEVEFGLSAPPPGDTTALLHYSAFDSSYQQQDSYRLYGSGRHYFNAPKATPDNAVAAVTIWATNARVWSFANALHCYGPALFTGPVTLPAAPTLPLQAATKGYVDAAIASGGVNLAADYPWTGNHSWTKPLTLLTSTGSIHSKYSNGVDTQILHHSPSTNYTYVGPLSDANGGSGGYLSLIQFVVGTGTWPAVGTVVAASNAWVYNTHVDIYGNLRLTNNTTQGLTGTASLTLGQQVGINATDNAGTAQRWFSYDSINHIPTLEREGYFLFSGPGRSGLYSGGSVLVSAYRWDFQVSLYVGAGWLLTLGQDPAAPLEAATKQYVDGKVATIPVFSTAANGLVPKPATASASQFLTAAGTWATAGAASVDLAANYPWTGLHTWTQQGTFNGNLATTRLGVGDSPKAYAQVHVLSTTVSEFVFEFTNNTDGAVYFQCATAGSMPNSRGRGRAYLSSYGDLIIGNHDGTPGALPETRAAFFDIGTLPAKRSLYVFGYTADANSCFVVQLGNAPNTTLFAVGTNGDVAVSRDPTIPLGVATKQYVDAHAGGSGSVDLAANYAWTGLHTFAKQVVITHPTDGGLTLCSALGTGSPFLNLTDGVGTALAYVGVARQAGAFISTSSVNDLCVLAPIGHIRVESTVGTTVFRNGGVDAAYINSGGLSVINRVAVNQAIDSRTRLSVSAVLPDWCMSFTNALNASVNFAADTTSINANSQGTAYQINYGDFVWRSYQDGGALDMPAMRMFSHFSTGTLFPAIRVFGYAGALTSFFSCTVGGTIVFQVLNNGDVTVSQDPATAMAVATKQYCDGKVLKAGDTMSGLLTLSGNATSALHAVPKQQLDAKFAAVGANGSNAAILMSTELLTLSTAGVTTDTAANLLPANSIILAIEIRVTTTIATATAFTVGDATVADRFLATGTALTSGTTAIGTNMWVATRTAAGQGQQQVAAAKVRVTTTGTPTAGAVRISVWYIQLTAPTS